MQTRRQRFFAAVSICQARIKESITSTEQNNLIGWQFTKANHPLDNNKMAIAEHPMSLHGEYDPANPQIRFKGTLFLTAVRLASTTEVSAGIGISIHGAQSDMRNTILDSQNMTGLVYCYETAPAYKDTAQIRIDWKFDAGTTKSNAVLFRGIPRLNLISQTLIFFEKQMTDQWSNGDAPTNETALSSRTAALANGDKIVFGIPWIHHDHELVAEANLSKLLHAISKVKALVES